MALMSSKEYLMLNWLAKKVNHRHSHQKQRMHVVLHFSAVLLSVTRQLMRINVFIVPEVKQVMETVLSKVRKRQFTRPCRRKTELWRWLLVGCILTKSTRRESSLTFWCFKICQMFIESIRYPSCSRLSRRKENSSNDLCQRLHLPPSQLQLCIVLCIVYYVKLYLVLICEQHETLEDVSIGCLNVCQTISPIVFIFSLHMADSHDKSIVVRIEHGQEK